MMLMAYLSYMVAEVSEHLCILPDVIFMILILMERDKLFNGDGDENLMTCSFSI